MPDISLGSVPRGSADLQAYVARPSGSGPWPGVVAMHEAFGLDPVIRRQHLDELKRISEDVTLHKQFLYRSALFDSLNSANAVE